MAKPLLIILVLCSWLVLSFSGPLVLWLIRGAFCIKLLCHKHCLLHFEIFYPIKKYWSLPNVWAISKVTFASSRVHMPKMRRITPLFIACYKLGTILINWIKKMLVISKHERNFASYKILPKIDCKILTKQLSWINILSFAQVYAMKFMPNLVSFKISIKYHCKMLPKQLFRRKKMRFANAW